MAGFMVLIADGTIGVYCKLVVVAGLHLTLLLSFVLFNYKVRVLESVYIYPLLSFLCINDKVLWYVLIFLNNSFIEI